MEHPKPLKQLNDDELLEIASQKGNASRLTFDNDVLSFLYAYDLRPGTNHIAKGKLYTLYRAWSKLKWTKSRFIKEAVEVLPGNKRFFFVDIDTFKVLNLVDALATPAVTERSNYAKFIDKFSIKPGNDLVEDYILYFYYDKDRHSKRLKTGSKIQFNRALKKRLESKFYKNITYYKLDITELKIPWDKIKMLRATYEKKVKARKR